MSARSRAERCFALARSTTFPAERATAVERGIAIARSAGLDLDSFDIPGRQRPVKSVVGTFEAATITVEAFAEIMRQMDRHRRERGL